MPDKTVTVRFDPATTAKLETEAARRDVSVAWLVRRAVERALPAWEQADLG